MRYWIVGLTSLASLVAAACGDTLPAPTTPKCVETFCEAGTRTCFGNTSATCKSDGTSYTLNACGDTSYCDSNGQCQQRTCAFPGNSQCKDHKTVQSCNAQGTATSEKGCAEGQICEAGSCSKIPCEPGTTKCGWRMVATCSADGNTWERTDCGATEICVDGACQVEACHPGSVVCDGEGTSNVCKADGSGYAAKSCGDKKTCYEDYGACLSTLCTPPTGGDVVDSPDTAEPDTSPPKDIPPPVELEPLDEAELTIDGEKIVFTSNKNATYVETDKDLRILMDKGLIKIEISLKPLEEFDVGHWTSEQAGEVNVTVYFHDGSVLPPGAQYKYQSVDYDVELLKFQAKGGRVKGTFSGTFTGDGGQTLIPFTDGYFDVERHD